MQAQVYRNMSGHESNIIMMKAFYIEIAFACETIYHKLIVQ